MTTATATQQLTHWIGGGPDDGTAERFGDVTESATGRLVARVPFATSADVDRAVQAAAAAQKEWAAASLTKRTQVLFAFR